MAGLGKMPKNAPKMAKFGFSANNFGTEGPRDLKFGLLASPGDDLQLARTISDILDFGCGLCYTLCLSTALNTTIVMINCRSDKTSELSNSN